MKLVDNENFWMYLSPQYAEDQAAFFADYCVSHAKLSELGAEWEVRFHHRQLHCSVPCRNGSVAMGDLYTCEDSVSDILL